jgi:hypothetical protein
MTGADAKYRPQTVILEGPDGGQRESWAIDGRLISKGPISVDEMTRAQREMDDMPGRLRHMDELGTDIQVLSPTIFLGPVTAKPEVEAALYRSWSWQRSKGGCPSGEWLLGRGKVHAGRREHRPGPNRGSLLAPYHLEQIDGVPILSSERPTRTCRPPLQRAPWTG